MSTVYERVKLLSNPHFLSNFERHHSLKERLINDWCHCHDKINSAAVNVISSFPYNASLRHRTLQKETSKPGKRTSIKIDPNLNGLASISIRVPVFKTLPMNKLRFVLYNLFAIECYCPAYSCSEKLTRR
ncbi:hypothetical protein AVEN_271794-1 [Araneus ventricosus]|uniref:Uncharacterized protein n=1 Tax=Araneus ventricosus TaxID=182803 RepID=A0A4Y2IG94_ARAVE|nr:hypothetical protein AVEN_271794-1 [Araneus ventricosus]